MTTSFLSCRAGLCSLGFLLLVGALVSSTQTAPSAAEPVLTKPALNRVVIPKLQSELKIDGQLDEPVWAKAAYIAGFQKNDGTGPEREKTELRLWYDDRALHLGITCHDTDIQATMTNRDSKFWEEEVVEFFVTAGTLNLKRYFELQWNPLGGVFDAIIDNQLGLDGLSRSIKGDWTFTANQMQSAVLLKGTPAKPDDQDDLWQVEVTIPFADLGQNTPKAGDVWRGNFYRFNRAQNRQPELLSWSPNLTPSFHQPSRFGFLEFGR